MECAKQGTGASRDRSDPGAGASRDRSDPGAGASRDRSDPGAGASRDRSDPGAGASRDRSDPGAGASRDSSDPIEIGVVYLKGKSKQTLDSWMKKFLPSKITKHDGFDWISVVCPDDLSDTYTRSGQSDVVGLRESWAHLTASDTPINFQSIKEIATKHKVIDGKWCLFASTGGKIDHFWSLIARHVIEDSTFPCRMADVKTACLDGVWKHEHVICMYTDNFNDKDTILKLEEAIRKLGIKSQLFYKPVVYDYLDVFSSTVTTTPLSLKTTIMRSDFDIIQGRSVITDIH